MANVSAVATTMDVTSTGYAATVNRDIGRRDLQIQLANGTRLWRRVTAVTAISASVERLTIAALGQAITPADVVAISWMTAVRAESDIVELRWWNWETVNAQLLYRGFRNDV